jgi:hypothetical protein
MDLSILFRYSEEELQRALAQNSELGVSVSKDADVLVQRGDDGGYVADLRVNGSTVVFVRADEFDRFRQRLKEQIAIHVPRDQQPDLREP